MTGDDLQIRIIDAITSDLNSSAALPQHQTVKYTRPVVVIPEDCPLLCVWLVGKRMTPRTTEDFDNIITIGVSWQVWVESTISTLKEDPRRSMEMLKVMARLEQRIRTLWREGWSIPEAYEIWPDSVDYVPSSAIETGLVQGYAMTVRVGVQEQG